MTHSTSTKKLSAKQQQILKELEPYWIDPAKDYRRIISRWKVDARGNLIWLKDKRGNVRDYYVIEREQLSDDDWISHMRGKLDYDEFGEFVCAYLYACQKAGITRLSIKLYGFDDDVFRFVEE